MITGPPGESCCSREMLGGFLYEKKKRKTLEALDLRHQGVCCWKANSATSRDSPAENGHHPLRSEGGTSANEETEEEHQGWPCHWATVCIMCGKILKKYLIYYLYLYVEIY